MGWRGLATDLDAQVVHTFDENDPALGITVSLQKMAGGSPSGSPIPIPTEFDSAYVDQVLQDGEYVSTTRPVAWLHYADLEAVPTTAAINDRLVITGGPNAGTYSIDSLEPNSDSTGVMLRLKIARTT